MRACVLRGGVEWEGGAWATGGDMEARGTYESSPSGALSGEHGCPSGLPLSATRPFSLTR